MLGVLEPRYARDFLPSHNEKRNIDHGHISETRQQLKKWVFQEGQGRSLSQQVMTTVFRYACGKLHIDYLQKNLPPRQYKGAHVRERYGELKKIMLRITPYPP